MGIPSGIQSMCFSLSNVVLQSSINRFGDVAVEGNSAGSNIAGFIYIVVYSFAQTATVFAGQNLGAGRLDRMNRILKDCALCTAVSGLVVGVLSAVFAHPLLSLYAPGNEAAIEIGILHMKMIGPPYFLYGVMAVGAGMMQGMGRPVLPMMINLGGTCVLRLVWVAFLGLLVPGYENDPSNIQFVYLCYPVSWSCTLVAQYISYFTIKKKMERGLLKAKI
jgi:Na+-driven multidrug efflux pump